MTKGSVTAKSGPLVLSNGMEFGEDEIEPWG